MNAIANMAANLATARHQVSGPSFPPTTRINIIREHLRTCGPATAAELGALVDLPATRTSALMCYDIRGGRIEVDRSDYPPTYRLTDRPPLPPSLLRAIEQLEEMGYTIVEPMTQRVTNQNHRARRAPFDRAASTEIAT
jgi:hypothetical protein